MHRQRNKVDGNCRCALYLCVGESQNTIAARVPTLPAVHGSLRVTTITGAYDGEAEFLEGVCGSVRLATCPQQRRTQAQTARRVEQRRVGAPVLNQFDDSPQTGERRSRRSEVSRLSPSTSLRVVPKSGRAQSRQRGGLNSKRAPQETPISNARSPLTSPVAGVSRAYSAKLRHVVESLVCASTYQDGQHEQVFPKSIHFTALVDWCTVMYVDSYKLRSLHAENRQGWIVHQSAPSKCPIDLPENRTAR
ncbi:hypothetical protein MTO96_013646 [Rhipicephalus appendiculatus]